DHSRALFTSPTAADLLRFYFLPERTRCRSARRRQRGLERRRRRRKALGRLDLDVVIPVNPGPRRNQVPDDDVLLETQQIVLGPADRRIGQDARGLLERRRRNKRLRRQARLRDAEQQRLAGGRLAALLHRALVDLAEDELVHVLAFQELGVARLDDFHL